MSITQAVQSFAVFLRTIISHHLSLLLLLLPQVDEPALREGLPLKQSRWEGYLTWAVDAFRLSTSCANPETQIVTHLCYSDFQDIMHAIDDMDGEQQ